MSHIFISYRRDDARGWAPSLHRVLTRHFASENVFYDRRILQGGDDWFAEIANNIAAADAVVVLIGPDWIGPDGGRGTNRLSESADVVRREIELALNTGRWVVPGPLEARAAPVAGDIPASLLPLLALHMIPMRSDIFEEDAERLVTLLITRLHDPGQVRDSVRRQKFTWLIEQLIKGFGGRSDALARIRTFLDDPDQPALLVKAPAGFGKTTLLARVIAGGETPFAFHLFNASFAVDSIREADFLASMVEQLMAWQGVREQVLADDLGWLKGRFASLLRTLPRRDHVVVLDGLDEINGVWDVRPYVETLRGSVRVLASTRTGGPADDAYGFASAEVYVLGGFSTDEVKDVLVAAGPRAALLSAEPTAVAAVAKIAATEEPGVIGADPFVVRFVARDLERHELTLEALSTVKSSGLTAYLNHWLDQITAAVGDDERPMLLLGLLAAAHAPLTTGDLERLLPPAPNRLVKPRLEETLRPVRRFVMTVPDSGFQLVHARLAKHLRGYLDVTRTRDHLIDDCLAWRVHHSPYAIRWLVPHLVEAGRTEEAWRIVTEEDGEGRNVWYAADVATDNRLLDSDRLAWYLDDLSLLTSKFVELGQPLERIITLALLQGSVAAISERVPLDLLHLMSSLGGGMQQRAMTLARRRATPIDRLRALAVVIEHVAEPDLQRVLGAEAVAAAADPEKPRARSKVLTGLAPRLSADLAQRAADIALEAVTDAVNVEAVAALAARLPAGAATQIHAGLWTSIHDVQSPLDRAKLLAAYARQGLPDAERAVAEAIEIVTAAVDPTSTLSPHKLATAIIQLAPVAEVPWELFRDVIATTEESSQVQYVRDLLEAPGATPVVPAVNHLIGLSSSEERGRAFAAALPHLAEEEARTLAFGVSWDIIEFSWLLSGLPEALRADAARMVLEHVLKETPSDHSQAAVLARAAPFLGEADRARAIQFMEASAAAMPLVPAAEEMGRQVAAMLQIKDADTGRTLEFEMSVGPTRADTLTLLAQTVDFGSMRPVVERALHAAQAIDDRLPMALAVSDLSRDCAPVDVVRLQHAAIDLILAIEWDATRAEGLQSIADDLAPESREYAMAKMTFEAPEMAGRAEAALVAARRPLASSDVSRLLELLPQLNEDEGAWLIEAVAADLPDDRLTDVLDRALSWEQSEFVSRAVTALAPRIAPERAVQLLEGRSWSESAVEALFTRFPDEERNEFTPSVWDSVMNQRLPGSRALALMMLQRLRLPALEETKIHDALETTLPKIDAGSPRTMVAMVALALPEGSPSRDSLISLALRRDGAADDSGEWARGVALLAASMTPAQVLEQFDGLEALEPANRAVALKGISAAIAKHFTRADARSATLRILAMMRGDERRDLLSELRSLRPALSTLLSESGRCALADDILRVQRWFP